VASGRVWVSFDCDQVSEGSMSTCKINPGFAIFENCTE